MQLIRTKGMLRTGKKIFSERKEKEKIIIFANRKAELKNLVPIVVIAWYRLQ